MNGEGFLKLLFMEPRLTCCKNCSSIWEPGSEEWSFQQCAACGWRPGDDVGEDDDFYDYDDE